MKINKVYCFGERSGSCRNNAAVRLFYQNKLTDFYRSFKKRQQITAVRKMSRYQKHGKTEVIWMLNTRKKNYCKTN